MPVEEEGNADEDLRLNWLTAVTDG